MNFLAAIFPKQAQPLRHVIATREESRAVARKRIDTQLQLAVYVATTTPEQRKAETEAVLGNTKARAAIARASRPERKGE